MPGRVVEVGREGERGVRLAGVRSGGGGGVREGVEGGSRRVFSVAPIIKSRTPRFMELGCVTALTFGVFKNENKLLTNEARKLHCSIKIQSPTIIMRELSESFHLVASALSF